MKIALLIFLVIGSIILYGCFSSNNGSEYSGIYPNGTSNFPSNPVSIDDAVREAKPYLNTTFELRKTMITHRANSELFIWVTLKGRYYYIVLDNYPSYSPGFYLHHAVKIDKENGAVIPPQ